MCTLYRNSEYQSTGYLNAIFTIAYRTQAGSPVSGKLVKETPCSESERGGRVRGAVRPISRRTPKQTRQTRLRCQLLSEGS